MIVPTLASTGRVPWFDEGTPTDLHCLYETLSQYPVERLDVRLRQLLQRLKHDAIVTQRTCESIVCVNSRPWPAVE